MIMALADRAPRLAPRAPHFAAPRRPPPNWRLALALVVNAGLWALVLRAFLALVN